MSKDQQLEKLEQLFANHGFKIKDRICICLPEVPEKDLAIKVCKKMKIDFHFFEVNQINANTLTNFLSENKIKGLIVSDWTVINGKPVPTKTIADRASIGVPTLEFVFIVKNLNKSVSWLDGRDIWFEAK